MFVVALLTFADAYVGPALAQLLALVATGADDPERRKKIEVQVPLRRLGTMEELAQFTAVLLDGCSRFQTGQFFSSAAVGVSEHLAAVRPKAR